MFNPGEFIRVLLLELEYIVSAAIPLTLISLACNFFRSHGGAVSAIVTPEVEGIVVLVAWFIIMNQLSGPRQLINFSIELVAASLILFLGSKYLAECHHSVFEPYFANKKKGKELAYVLGILVRTLQSQAQFKFSWNTAMFVYGFF